MIALGYKWIRFLKFRDRRGGEMFLLLFVSTHCWRSATVRGPWGEEEEEEGRLRRQYPLDWHIKAEACRANSQVLRGKEYWWWLQLTEPSRNFSKLLLETVGGELKDWKRKSKSLCLYFHPSLWAGLCKSSLVVNKGESTSIRINAKALNVFMESTL